MNGKNRIIVKSCDKTIEYRLIILNFIDEELGIRILYFRRLSNVTLSLMKLCDYALASSDRLKIDPFLAHLK